MWLDWRVCKTGRTRRASGWVEQNTDITACPQRQSVQRYGYWQRIDWRKGKQKRNLTRLNLKRLLYLWDSGHGKNFLTMGHGLHPEPSLIPPF